MKRRRNAPLTASQAAALRSILADHSATKRSTNPKRRTKKRRASGRKRKVSPKQLRALRRNLIKARKARWGK
jgi:hypothetical protein